MQHREILLKLSDHLEPGRYHKSDFDPEEKVPYGVIQGELGRYFVKKQFATGGTSRIKMLENIETHEKWVLKIIWAHTNVSASKAPEIYKKEYDILKKLGRIDPVIIQTTSKKGQKEEKYGIVEKLVEGHELFELLGGDKTHLLTNNPKKLMQIALNIILDFFMMHQAGILLIDDKIENIMVNGMEVTRIDFGLAEDGYDFTQDKGLKTGFSGTPETFAPEVLNTFRTALLNKKPISLTFNEATDIFSLGVVLRTLLMGETPEFLEGGKIYLTRVFSPVIRDAIQAYPGIRKLILEMTSDKPEARLPAVKKLVEAIEEVLKLEKGSTLAKLNKKTPSDNEQPADKNSTLEAKPRP